MTTSYVKPCMYCKKEIEMSDRAAGQWLPYEIEDGNLHECKNKKSGKKLEERRPQLKTIMEAQVFLEGIEARVKKLESVVLDPRRPVK